MENRINRQVVLTRHVKGPAPPDVFHLAAAPLPKCGPGQILLRNHYASIEPGTAGAITGDDYLVPSVPVSGLLSAFTVGTVIASRSAKFREGDLVHGFGGWQDYAALQAEPEWPAQMRPYVVDITQAAPELFVGPLGLSGFTAFIGMQLVAKPKPAETVVVSAAAGAVGGLAGQYAKLDGARVVGIAGGPEKCAYVTQVLGLDAALDYKQELAPQLDAACPDGIDVYFENVGGAVLDAVWPRMNSFGRIPLCGQVAQYQLAERPRGPNLFEATIKRLTLTGIMGLDAFHGPCFDRFKDETIAGFATGRLKQKIDLIEGLENATEGWRGLFRGENIGKRVLKISEIGAA